MPGATGPIESRGLTPTAFEGLQGVLPPAFAGPTTAVVAKETTFLFTGGDTISVSDPDDSYATLKLGVDIGNITADVGPPFGRVDVGTLSYSAGFASINNVLKSLAYTPPAGFEGVAAVSVYIYDGLTLTGQQDIIIAVGNEAAPVNTLPVGAPQAIMNSPLSVAGVSVADANGDKVTSTLTVAHGTLSVSGGNAGGVSGDGTTTLVITGTPAQVSSKLASLSYTPATGYTGTDTLQMQSSDRYLTDIDSQSINVLPPVADAAPVNTVPLTTITTNKDASVAVAGMSVADADGDALTSTLTVTHGTLSVAGGNGVNVSGDGTSTLVVTGSAAQINLQLASLNYTPAASYLGTDSLLISTTDQVLIDVDAVSINVVNPNIGLPAGPLAAVEDTARSISGVTVPAGTVQVQVSTSQGILWVGGGGGSTAGNFSSTLLIYGTQAEINARLTTLQYAPNFDFNGADELKVLTFDGSGQQFASVNIDVAAVADATNDNISAVEDTVANFNVLTGTGGATADTFSDPGKTASVLTGPSHGTLVLGSNGAAKYTPDADYNGPDSFTYVVNSNGGPETATVTIDVAARPDAVDDFVTTTEDAAATFNVLTGTGGASADSFTSGTVTANTTPLHGSIIIGANGAVTYTPNADFHGTDSFTYTVTAGGSTETATVHLTIDPVADAVDDTISLSKDSTANFNVLTGTGGATADTFADPSRAVTAHSDPSHGTLVIDANGAATYTPTAGYTGADSFTYTVTSAGSTETATVTLFVMGNPPSVTAPALSIDEDTSVALSGGNAILLNDPDGDITTVTVSYDAARGSLPQIGDGEVVNGDIHTLTFNGTQGDIQTRLANLTFTPVANFVGNATISVVATDANSQTGGTTLTITVNPVDDTPDATINVVSGSTIYTGLLDGTLIPHTFGFVQTFINGVPSYTVGIETGFANPAHGSVTVDAQTGLLTLTVAPDFSGTETFTYSVDTPYGEHETAVVTVQVNAPPVITAPPSVGTSYTDAIKFDNGNTVSVADTEGDVSSVELSVDSGTIQVTLTGGTAAIAAGANASGAFTLTGSQDDINATLATLQFTPSATYVIHATLSVTAHDAASTVIDTVNIAVAPIVIAAPSALQSATEDSPFQFTGASAITVNDAEQAALDVQFDLTDQDGHFIDTFTLNTGSYISGTPAEVNAQLAGLVFTPPADFVGPVVLSIAVKRADQGWGGFSEVRTTINFDVLAVADATNDTVVVNRDSAITFNVLTGTGGATADTFSHPAAKIIDFSQPANGTLVAGANPGEFTFTPDAGYLGTTTFTYQVKSGSLFFGEGYVGGNTETATVTIVVNDAPTQNVPASLNAFEDTPLAVSSISVADTDSTSITTTLSVLHGTVSVSGSSGVVTGSGTDTLTITGTVAQVNARLASLVYNNTADYNGADTLSVSTTDGAATVAGSSSITIAAVADIVADTISTASSTLVNFNVFAANPTTADSFENAAHTVTSVTALSNPAAGTLNSDVNGNGDGSMSFMPAAGFKGTVTFDYTVTSGGVTETATVTIDVGNAPPTQTVPATLAATEDTPLAIGSITVNDVDNASVTTTVSVLHGTVSVGGNDANVSGDGSATMTISGTLAQVNAKLASLVYSSVADYYGADTLSVSTTDGAATVLNTAAITVAAVTDIVADTIDTP